MTHKQTHSHKKEYIFEQFLVLKRTSALGTDDELLSNISVTLRLRSKTRRKQPLDKNIARFCFPEQFSRDRNPAHHLEDFCFTLTDSDSSQLFGFCRRHRTSDRSLECLVMLSREPLWSLVHPLMDLLHSRWLLEPKACIRLLQQLARKRIPESGHSVQLDASPFTYGFHKAYCERPPVTPLFQSLSIDNILWLLDALLSERRIIITSASLSLLSAVVHALPALITPFRWEHIFIPLLPASLSHYVTAPMPFIVGVDAVTLSRLLVLDLEMESVVFVDLDKDSISVRNSHKIVRVNGGCGNLPSALVGKIRKRLTILIPERASLLKRTGRQALHKLTHQQRRAAFDFDQNQVYDVFLAFLLQAFASWPQYVQVSAGSSAKFQLDRFLSECATAVGGFEFYQSVCRTQLFATFLGEREDAYEGGVFSGRARSRLARDSDPVRYRFERVSEGLHGDVASLSRIMDSLEKDRHLHWIVQFQSDVCAFQLFMDLTSNKTETLSQSLMRRLCEVSCFSDSEFQGTLSAFWARLDDCGGKNWGHAFKALSVGRRLLESGNDRFVGALIRGFRRLQSISECYVNREPELQRRVREIGREFCGMLRNISGLTMIKCKVWEGLGSVDDYYVESGVVDTKKSNSTVNAKKKTKEIVETAEKRKVKDNVLEKAFEGLQVYRRASCVQGSKRVLPDFEDLHKQFEPKELVRVPVEVEPLDLFDLLDFSSVAVNAEINSITKSKQLPWDDLLDVYR